MELVKAKEVVSETGRLLLQHGLVARTWGNVSARLDEENMVITPSGLGYDRMTADDVVEVNTTTGEWKGEKKPSSEKGIHAAAYRIFPDVAFVIHTHQNCATALGLAGFEALDITREEKERLGGIALARYGLPGTKKLKNNVEKAYQTGAKVVLMAHHGAVICGRDREDTMEKAILLEEICRRNVKGVPTECLFQPAGREILEKIRKQYPYADVVDTPAGLVRASQKDNLPAQVDDMAQIIGASIIHAEPEPEDILHKLEKTDAILVEGIGVVIKTEEPDDLEALKMLVEKAVICNLHTKALGVKARLSYFDTRLMRRVYVTKYSKRK